MRPNPSFSLLASVESRVSRGVDLHVEKRDGGPSTSTLNAPTDRLLQSLGYPVKSGATVTSDTAMNVSAVYACVNILSSAIAALPLRVMRTTKGGCEEVPDHAASDLVKHTPDGARTAFAWRQMMEATALLRGNSPARVQRNAYFEPEKIGWMNPLQFEIWRTMDGDPFYRYRGEMMKAWEVLNYKELALDGITGISPVTAMREQIGLAITTQEHGSRHFSNGARPGVVLMAPLGATKQQMDQIRDEVQKNHGGVANSGKPFIAYGGLTVSTVSLSNADSQFLESRKFDIEEIARAYRVPLVLLQSTEKTTSWGSGIEQLNRMFIDWSLQPRLTSRESELNICLLSKKDRDDGLYFKHDTSALTAGSNADRAEYYQTMRNIGAMSINDVREREGMNDLPGKIGDDYEQPFNGNGGSNAADKKPGAKAAPADPANPTPEATA